MQNRLLRMRMLAGVTRVRPATGPRRAGMNIRRTTRRLRRPRRQLEPRRSFFHLPPRHLGS